MLKREREREDKKNFSEKDRLPLNAHCVVSQQRFPSDIRILEIVIGHPHGSFLAEVHIPPPHPTPTPPHLPCFSTDALVCSLTPKTCASSRRSRPTATGCVSLSDREMNWRGVRLRLHKGAGTGFLQHTHYPPPPRVTFSADDALSRSPIWDIVIMQED